MTKESAILQELRSFHRERFPERFNLAWLQSRYHVTESDAKKILERFKAEGEA